MRPPPDGGRRLTDGGIELSTAAEPEESPTQAVLRAIAAVADVQPTELAPLYESVDPDALDGVLQHVDERDGRVRVAFTFEGYGVVVHSDGRVRITDDTPASMSIDSE